MIVTDSLLVEKDVYIERTAEKEDEVYPVTVKEISEAQWAHKHYVKYFKDTNKTFKDKNRNISIRVINDELILVYKDTRLVIPTIRMQNKALQWYHHYLMHPEETRMIETLTAVLY